MRGLERPFRTDADLLNNSLNMLISNQMSLESQSRKNDLTISLYEETGGLR